MSVFISRYLHLDLSNQRCYTNIGQYNHLECPEEKETTSVLSNKLWTGRQGKTSAVDDKTSVSHQQPPEGRSEGIAIHRS